MTHYLFDVQYRCRRMLCVVHCFAPFLPFTRQVCYAKTTKLFGFLFCISAITIIGLAFSVKAVGIVSVPKFLIISSSSSKRASQPLELLISFITFISPLLVPG